MSISKALKSEDEIISNWGEYSVPLVSICCTTYNHAKFVQDALESFLTQETNFPFEIIIFDDASTDTTQDIIRSYVNKYPRLFVPFLQKENLWQGKRISGTFTISFPHAKGKYIAWCEGDDFWTDPLKLQKQVNFLDSHPECSICFHDVKEIYDDRPNKSQDSACIYQKEVLSLEDLLKNNFCYTCTSVFRRDLFKYFPDWLKFGDYPLWVFYAKHGSIGYLHEIMAAYRHHENGAWSSSTKAKQLQHSIRSNRLINRYLDFKYRNIIKEKISYFYYEIALDSGKAEDFRSAFCSSIRSLWECPINSRVSTRTLLKIILKSFFALTIKESRIINRINFS